MPSVAAAHTAGILLAVACAVALLRLPGAPARWSGRLRTVVDGLIVAGAVSIVVPSIFSAHAAALQAAGAMGLVLATRSPRGAADPPLIAGVGLLVASLGVLATADGVLPAFFLVALPAGWIAVVVAALQARRIGPAIEAGLPRTLSVTIPSFPLAVAVVTLGAGLAAGKEPEQQTIWIAVAVAVSVIARQVLALLENLSYWRDLEAAIRARSEEAERREQRFRALVSNSKDAIVVVDEEGRVDYATPSMERVFGIPASDLNSFALARLTDAPGRTAFGVAYRAALAAPGEPQQAELRFRRHDGAWGEAELILVDLRADPAVAGLVVTARDVTDRKELWRRASHDPLTGLANRQVLLDRLEHALSLGDRLGQPPAVLFVDLDDFKRVNDTYGHAAGDEVLRVVAGRLCDAVRASDTVARIGGDEFAVITEQANGRVGAHALAERLAQSLATPMRVAGDDYLPTASIGVAIAVGEESCSEVLGDADAAMYDAKRAGKACVRLAGRAPVSGLSPAPDEPLVASAH